jgi:ring-1,2-phenylacetyl-CoA epoxidase subunit PaaE
VFSGYACDRLRVGDTIEVLPPAGRFFTPLDPLHAKHYVAIAGGSGITPVLSLVSTALQVEPDSRFTVLAANRTASSIMFLDELERLRDGHLGRLDLLHLLDGETRDVELLSGRLDGPRLERILDLLLPPHTVDEWFLCGPAGLVEAARSTLLARGVPADRVHRELFIASTPPPAGALTGPPAGALTGPPAGTLAGPPAGTLAGSPAEGPPSVQPPAGSPWLAPAAQATVRLDGRTSTVDVPAGSSVLDAVLRVRPDAPYACRGGVCGTCRARLVEGEVELAANYALEQHELDAGYVLACQSRPLTPAVRLDFDV